MNKSQRHKLLVYCEDISDYTDMISDIASDEMVKVDNIPDNLRESERFQTMESNADMIFDACDSIKEAVGTIMGMV